jgi:hypothetical protein
MIFWMLFVLSANAQPHEFRFFPIKGMVLEQQVLVGKLGIHFFLLSQETTADMRLYIYDTAAQIGNTKAYAFTRPLASVLFYEKSVLFTSLTQDRGNVMYHFMELDEEGNLLRKKDGLLPGMKSYARMLVSADKKNILFYQYIKRSGDSSLIRGSLLNAELGIVKQLAYSFKHDTEQDSDPETFLDNNGNVHILVFDKFTNYRISSDLSVNTISFGEEQIVSETFNFSKVKLKSMRVFQNNECNCMQAEGLYVDGTTKTNKGIYSIAFPLGRKNELAPRFIPFSEEMIKNFKRGFSATEAMIQNSLQLQDIIYSDSGSFVILRLNSGPPQRVQKIGPEDDASISSLNRNLGVSRGLDYQPPPVTTTTTVAGTTRIRTTPLPGSLDKYASTTPLSSGGLPSRSSPLSSRASGRNAPKFICVKLEKERGFEWHTNRSLDVFNLPDDNYNHLFLAGGSKDELALALYQADAADEPYPVFITVKNGKQLLERFPEKKLIFSPIQLMGYQQYGTLYTHTDTGEGGLMLIHAKEQPL